MLIERINNFRGRQKIESEKVDKHEKKKKEDEKNNAIFVTLLRKKANLTVQNTEKHSM